MRRLALAFRAGALHLNVVFNPDLFNQTELCLEEVDMFFFVNVYRLQ